jgi:hypothetical protein
LEVKIKVKTEGVNLGVNSGVRAVARTEEAQIHVSQASVPSSAQILSPPDSQPQHPRYTPPSSSTLHLSTLLLNTDSLPVLLTCASKGTGVPSALYIILLICLPTTALVQLHHVTLHRPTDLQLCCQHSPTLTHCRQRFCSKMLF